VRADELTVYRRVLFGASINKPAKHKVMLAGSGIRLATRNPTTGLLPVGLLLREDACRLSEEAEANLNDPPRRPRDELITVSFHSHTLPP
jgi:hypothetical protein